MKASFFSIVAADLSADQAAEVVVTDAATAYLTDDSVLRDTSKLPFIPIASKEYYVIKSAKLVHLTSRTFSKFDGKGNVNGVAFSVEGSVYASQDAFRLRKVIDLEVRRLVASKPLNYQDDTGSHLRDDSKQFSLLDAEKSAEQLGKRVDLGVRLEFLNQKQSGE